MRTTRSSFPKGSFLSRLFIVGEQTTFLKHMVNGARAWLQPRNPFESAIVDCLVAAVWRHQRFAAFESKFLEIEPQSLPGFVKKYYDVSDDVTRGVLGLSPMVDKFTALTNFQTQALRQARELAKLLADLRKIFPTQNPTLSPRSATPSSPARRKPSHRNNPSPPPAPPQPRSVGALPSSGFFF